MMVKCECQHCGGHLEFDALEFRNVESITCTHCGQQTTLKKLVQPKATPTPSKTQLEYFEKTKRASQERGQIEDYLDQIGGVFFTGGIIGAAILGFLAIAQFATEGSGVIAVLTVASAVAAWFQGFVFRIVFRALAEIIRLLRKISNAKP